MVLAVVVRNEGLTVSGVALDFSKVHAVCLLIMSSRGSWRRRIESLCLQEVLEAPELMRCVLLWMLEAVEGGLCLLEMLEVPKEMRRVLSVCWRLQRVGFVCWRSWKC